MDILDTDIKFIKSVGEKRAQYFKKLGIRNARALLYTFPRRYEDWKNTVSIKDAKPEETSCLKVRLLSSPVSTRTSGGNLLTRVTATDGEDFLSVIFFNNKYVGKQLDAEKEYLFYGKVSLDRGEKKTMVSPRFLPAENNEYFHPVYAQTAGLNSKAIAKAVGNALTLFGDVLSDPLHENTRKKYGLPPLKEALKKIHFPASEDEIKTARRRLIYDELLILQLGLLSHGENLSYENVPKINGTALDDFLSRLPFSLTLAQRRSIGECLQDMGGEKPMRRLLQGDVGSGKTAVAAALIYCAAKSGGQSALMAPTEVLARQHYKTLQKFFESSGVTLALLTGSTGAKDRREILSGVKNGEIDLLIGTHAVITDTVDFRNLCLAVTDEQHRFGVTQRAALSSKGQNPHVLVMSATPIPRTLSLIIYGDLAISVLDEKPKGRQEIDTFAVDSSFHQRIYAFIKKQLDAGRQAYIVCPLAEEKETEEDEEEKAKRLSAEKYMKELSAGVFKDYPTALLHGKLKPKEKDQIMADFSEGKTRLLICTVVIEVGIDVPNANLIVIENAECFGLSQLHQLRGRVGRGDTKSYCILISDTGSEKSHERFDIMTKTNDGFQIAEKDLELRGPGDFFGARQSGLPSLRIANLMSDSKILYTAQADAKRIIAEDPALLKPEHEELRRSVKVLFADAS